MLFVLDVSVAGADTLVIPSQNELRDEKQLREDYFCFINIRLALFVPELNYSVCSTLICFKFASHKINSKVADIL